MIHKGSSIKLLTQGPDFGTKIIDHTIWGRKPENNLGGRAMKKHPGWIFIIVSALFFLIAPSTQAFLFKNNVEKAREYIKANMVDNALDLLKKEIEEKPTNAEAHFELGAIYLDQGLHSQAEQRFKGAVGLDAKFKARVARKHMQSAVVLMDKGNYRDSIRYFEVAASYQPSLKTEIAECCMKKANELINKGITQNTDSSTSETASII